ncbi:hypothetical protein [Streptosporangium saharense]|uniref:hypothetical protein n=1 Tax=Streptosporangium saharense TaxID=1706840 RepID=UPI003441A7CE
MNRTQTLVAISLLVVVAATAAILLWQGRTRLDIRPVTVTSVDAKSWLVQYRDEDGRNTASGIRPAWIDRAGVFQAGSFPGCLKPQEDDPQATEYQINEQVELATVRAPSTDVTPEQNVIVWIRCLR